MTSVDPDRQRIAAEVRAEMARQTKSQREIGEVLGLPQPAIHLRLTGKRAFKAEELVKLADALGVPIERFFTTPARAA